MNLKKLDDSKLVKLYAKGNEQALALLIERHQATVFGYLHKMLKSKEQSEDAFQDTFIKVIRTIKQGRYSDEGKFIGWVLRIAHNCAIDIFRKQKTMRTISHVKDTDNGEMKDIFSVLDLQEKCVEHEWHQAETHHEFRKFIRNLPPDQREVFILRQRFDYSFREIAEQLDININTALGRMHYAVNYLRKNVKKAQENKLFSGNMQQA